MGPERVVWASPSPQLPSGAGIAGSGGWVGRRRAVSRRGAARAAGRARRASGPSVDARPARRALSLPAVPRRWRTESGLSPTPEGGRGPGGPAPPRRRRRVHLAGSLERKGQVGGGGRLSPEPRPGRALPGCPRGEPLPVPFGSPAGLEAAALPGRSVVTSSTPAAPSPPGTLAPPSRCPVLQASLDVDQEEGLAPPPPPHRKLSVGGVPFADFGLLGGPLRGSGSENAIQVLSLIIGLPPKPSCKLKGHTHPRGQLRTLAVPCSSLVLEPGGNLGALRRSPERAVFSLKNCKFQGGETSPSSRLLCVHR